MPCNGLLLLPQQNKGMVRLGYGPAWSQGVLLHLQHGRLSEGGAWGWLGWYACELIIATSSSMHGAIVFQGLQICW